jgi:hypothetical protein
MTSPLFMYSILYSVLNNFPYSRLDEEPTVFL